MNSILMMEAKTYCLYYMGIRYILYTNYLHIPLSRPIEIKDF